MKCSFCDDEIEELNEEAAAHIVVSLSGTLKEQHTHVHVHDIADTFLLIKMVDAIIKECQLQSYFVKKGVTQ